MTSASSANTSDISVSLVFMSSTSNVGIVERVLNTVLIGSTFLLVSSSGISMLFIEFSKADIVFSSWSFLLQNSLVMSASALLIVSTSYPAAISLVTTFRCAMTSVRSCIVRFASLRSTVPIGISVSNADAKSAVIVLSALIAFLVSSVFSNAPFSSLRCLVISTMLSMCLTKSSVIIFLYFSSFISSITESTDVSPVNTLFRLSNDSFTSSTWILVNPFNGCTILESMPEMSTFSMLWTTCTNFDSVSVIESSTPLRASITSFSDLDDPSPSVRSIF